MKLSYELSALAIRDLERIWTYTASNWSAKQANIYYKSIIDTIDPICQYLDSGKSMAEIKENHRSIQKNPHHTAKAPRGPRSIHYWLIGVSQNY